MHSLLIVHGAGIFDKFVKLYRSVTVTESNYLWHASPELSTPPPFDGGPRTQCQSRGIENNDSDHRFLTTPHRKISHGEIFNRGKASLFSNDQNRHSQEPYSVRNPTTSFFNRNACNSYMLLSTSSSAGYCSECRAALTPSRLQSATSRELSVARTGRLFLNRRSAELEEQPAADLLDLL